jgi:spore coat protein U-like protein
LTAPVLFGRPAPPGRRRLRTEFGWAWAICRTIGLGLAALQLLLPDKAFALACSITPISGGYGTVNVLSGTVIDSTASITVTCTGGSANQVVRFCLNVGAGITALGPSNERVLRTSTDYIDHEYYFDAARTQLWGSWGIGAATAYPSAAPAGIQQDVTLNSSGNGTFNYTVYARILASQQNTTPGTYTWTGNSPTVQYRAQSGASSCPTNGGSADAGGSSFTATVNADCNISTTALTFSSSPSTIASNIDATATITAQCTNTTPYSIGLDNGSNVSGSQRRMRLGATSNYINYGLYTDAARSISWKTSTSTTSCTSGTSTCILGTGTGSDQSTTVYGRVPPQTAPASGTFSDTIVATITF